MPTRKTVTTEQETLEELAVQTLEEIMSNSQYLPEVRMAAAEKALRSLGKAEVTKSSSNPQLVLNFGDQLSKSLLGLGKTFELMKPADDQETH